MKLEIAFYFFISCNAIFVIIMLLINFLDNKFSAFHREVAYKVLSAIGTLCIIGMIISVVVYIIMLFVWGVFNLLQFMFLLS